ncbi:hypothetical protein BKA80DRAFT_33613 [Phyllosticta citrichinensis]
MTHTHPRRHILLLKASLLTYLRTLLSQPNHSSPMQHTPHLLAHRLMAAIPVPISLPLCRASAPPDYVTHSSMPAAAPLPFPGRGGLGLGQAKATG